MEFYPCMFAQYPDLRMGDIERGLDPVWYQRFEARRRSGARQECASCEFLGACGGSCLDWARKDPSSQVSPAARAASRPGGSVTPEARSFTRTIGWNAARNAACSLSAVSSIAAQGIENRTH